MSSQLSNSLAISNVSMLTAHLKAVSNPLNLFSTSTSPPPLLKTTIKEGSKSLLNYSNQLLLPRANYLNTKNWNQLNFNYDTNSSENFLTGNYLSQYLGQYKNIDYNTSLKLIDYSNNLTQSYEKNELDEQALDLSKSNKNQQKNLKQEEMKKTNLQIKINKRPSSLPNQSKSLTQIKKKNISSVKKPIRKMIFDEHKSSPVSGTFILNDDDAAWDVESCATRASDIDPRINLVQVTPEAIAELEKIENQIGDYICKLCKLRFEDAFKLAQHSCSRIGHIEYKCPECEKKFNCPANLASHRRWHKPSIKTNSADGLSKSQNSSKIETKKLSNSLNVSHEKLINSNLNSPTSKCSPQLIIDSNERTQKTIKLQDQIVSVSVIQDSDDNQVKISNNKVKVTGTAIIPEQSNITIDENEKSIENELTNKVINENESNIKEKLNDNYCPKKFRRQQYLISKSPKSENQENEMINCNTSLSENEEISNSSESLQTNLILQRKKRALSSVTTDENNLQMLKTEDVDEQVFIEQNSQESSNSFESQKKFLISKKLKSEQN